MNDDISEAAELYACSGLSSSKNVISQDEIKEHEVCEKPPLKDGAEGLQIHGSQNSQGSFKFWKGLEFHLTLNTMCSCSWIRVWA